MSAEQLRQCDKAKFGNAGVNCENNKISHMSMLPVITSICQPRTAGDKYYKTNYKFKSIKKKEILPFATGGTWKAVY